jgi:hypothetical protein
MKYFPLFLFPFIMAFALPTVAQLSQPMIDALSRSQLGANAELLATPEDRKTISDCVKTHLSPPWEELKALPPNQQMILLQAGIEQKTGQDYLDLAIAVVQGVADGGLSKQHAQMVLSPAASDKEGFLAVNFGDEKLAAALRKLVPLYADAPERVAFIEKVLSGKARDEYLKWSSLQGVQPIQPVTDVSATSQKQSPSIGTNGPITASPKRKSADSKPTLTPSEESASSIPWSIIVVLIVAATGLLWLLLKQRS